MIKNKFLLSTTFYIGHCFFINRTKNKNKNTLELPFKIDLGSQCSSFSRHRFLNLFLSLEERRKEVDQIQQRNTISWYSVCFPFHLHFHLNCWVFLISESKLWFYQILCSWNKHILILYLCNEFKRAILVIFKFVYLYDAKIVCVCFLSFQFSLIFF